MVFLLFFFQFLTIHSLDFFITFIQSTVGLIRSDEVITGMYSHDMNLSMFTCN